MWKRIKEIINGWRNDIIPPKELEEVINEVSSYRMEICRACPFNSENKKKEGYKTIRTDEHCTKCGCPLSKKTKSLESECPLTPPKWEALKIDEK